MLRAIGAFVFLVLLTVIGLLAMERVPPSYRAGVHSLVGLIGLLAVVWALVGGRDRKP
jgi:hypothetical protein